MSHGLNGSPGGGLAVVPTPGETNQFTVNATVVVAFGAPALVPVIVIVNVPRGPFRSACSFSVELLVAGLGVKDPLTLVGRPLTERFTGAEPLDHVTVMTSFTAIPPRATVTAGCCAASVNCAGAAD